jgi:prophage tail gpP-like protein
LQKRAESEALWHEGAIIEVNITVQGWKTPSGDLWRAGNVYKVVSAMISLNEPLGAQTVTFTQDRSAGTLTTLKLVQPRLLKISTKYANTDTPIVGVNTVPGPGATDMPPSNPVPYLLPPGTRMGDNGIEEIN